MLKPLAGIAIVAMLALPVLAQVRHHRTPEPIVGHVENSVVGPGEGEAALNAAMADMQAATDAAANAAADAASAAANAAAEAAGDDNVATDATAYDANADMSMDTNMSMDENMTVSENMSGELPAPTHRRRARPRHH